MRRMTLHMDLAWLCPLFHRSRSPFANLFSSCIMDIFWVTLWQMTGYVGKALELPLVDLDSCWVYCLIRSQNKKSSLDIYFDSGDTFWSQGFFFFCFFSEYGQDEDTFLEDLYANKPKITCPLKLTSPACKTYKTDSEEYPWLTQTLENLKHNLPT